MVSYPGDSLKMGVKELYNSGLFSDLELVCGDRTFKVHKAILYPQSTYFQSLLGGKFKEATESSIPVKEDPEIMAAVIYYIYNFRWEENNRSDAEDAIFAIRVYAAADFYNITQLRTLAVTRFKETLDPNDTPVLVDAIAAVEDYVAGKGGVFWEFLLPLVKKHMLILLRNDKFKALLDENKGLMYRLMGQLATGKKGEDQADEAKEKEEEVGDEDDDDDDDDENPFVARPPFGAKRQRTGGRYGPGRTLGGSGR